MKTLEVVSIDGIERGEWGKPSRLLHGGSRGTITTRETECCIESLKPRVRGAAIGGERL